MTSIPRKATTVILLREKGAGGFEVFLLKRHEKSSFMGGNYVYPGGRVDADDGLPDILPFCKGLSPQKAHLVLKNSKPAEENIGYWIAGIRELFEEAGVLFAYDQAGNLFRPRDSDDQERLSLSRTSIHRKELSFLELLRRESFCLALDQLYYYAHWITPEARPERFDTRFSLARHPEGQEANHDRKETTAGIWITPQQALEENLKGEVVLSPPTLKTLEDLARSRTIDEVFASLGKKEISPILPVLTKVSDGPLLVFPWDPDYPIFQRETLPQPLEHGHPSGPNDNSTRLLFKDGFWHPYCRAD